MKIKGNTILITGGATGIGLALAEEFVKAGNEVIICGRREEKLREAKERLPMIHTRKCDITREEERIALFDWVLNNFKELNVLVNNAGIQNMIDFRKGEEELLNREDEIDVNFKAMVYLSALFIPQLMKKEESAIINVSSGLGFVPIAMTPVYCATKAAVHSFTISLRYQLRETSIKVFELIFPTVDTELDRGARKKRGQTHFGISASEAVKDVLGVLEQDKFEIGIGQAENLMKASGQEKDEAFKRMNH